MCIHVVLVYSNDQQIEIDIEYDVKFAFRSLVDTINLQLHQNKTGNNYDIDIEPITFHQHSFIGIYHPFTHSIFEVCNVNIYSILHFRIITRNFHRKKNTKKEFSIFHFLNMDT